MNIKKCLLVFLIAVLAVPSAEVWAGSRSATIRVSCTILPALELSSAFPLQGIVKPSSDASGASSSREDRSLLALASQNQEILVSTNLGDNYRLSRVLSKVGSNSVRLYSLTAL